MTDQTELLELYNHIHANSPDLSLVSDDEIVTMISLINERGYFSSVGGNWIAGGYTDFSYLWKSGGEFAINTENEAEKFMRKQYAIETIQKVIVDFYNRRMLNIILDKGVRRQVERHV